MCDSAVCVCEESRGGKGVRQTGVCFECLKYRAVVGEFKGRVTGEKERESEEGRSYAIPLRRSFNLFVLFSISCNIDFSVI